MVVAGPAHRSLGGANNASTPYATTVEACHLAETQMSRPDAISSSLGREVLIEISDVVAETLKKAGVEPELAKAAGETALEEVRDRFGGQVVYIPKDQLQRTKKRWAEIWNEFNGQNHAELARKHGMGVHAIYRILQTMRRQVRDEGTQQQK